MPTLIRPFRRVQDNLEDPDECIESLEWAFTQDFQSAEPTNNVEAKQGYINQTYRILFRNNLEGNAAAWYSNLGPTARRVLDTLKACFLERYELVLQDPQTRLWEKKFELANLRQGKNESITKFLKRAEDLAYQISNSDIDVGMAIIQGMADENKWKQISFSQGFRFYLQDSQKTISGGVF